MTKPGRRGLIEVGGGVGRGGVADHDDLEASLAELRLTLPQFATLAHLHDQPGLPAATLSRLLPLTPQAVSNLLVRLEAAGYLRRGAPAAGRNQPLTDAGDTALAKALELVDLEQNRFFADLNDEQRTQLRELLITCLTHRRSPATTSTSTRCQVEPKAPPRTEKIAGQPP